MLLSSKIQDNHFYRFPFVATDILISCSKIAEKLIEQKEEGEEEEVEEQEFMNVQRNQAKKKNAQESNQDGDEVQLEVRI